MQTSSSDLKYFREAISLLLDKLLPYIDHKIIQQFCKGLKLKVEDDKVSPFSIYMETQKNFEGSQVKLCKVTNGSTEKLSTTVLQKIRFAQIEFKNNSQQFASVFNSVKENVQSVYVSSEQLQTMMSEKEIESKNEQRQEKIRRVSIYNKQEKRMNDKQISQENKVEQKQEVKYENKQENKIDVKIENKNQLKPDQKSEKYDPFVDQNKKEATPFSDTAKINKTYSGSQNYLKYNSPQQIQMPSMTYPHKSEKTSPSPSYNYIQTPPHSYNNQISTQPNSQVSSFSHSPQQPLSNQMNYTQQNDGKLQAQIGSYVPNYDLLARVDQLLQKSKNNTPMIQVAQPCLTNRT